MLAVIVDAQPTVDETMTCNTSQCLNCPKITGGSGQILDWMLGGGAEGEDLGRGVPSSQPTMEFEGAS